MLQCPKCSSVDRFEIVEKNCISVDSEYGLLKFHYSMELSEEDSFVTCGSCEHKFNPSEDPCEESHNE